MEINGNAMLQYNPERCGCSDTITISSCNDSKAITLDDLELQSQGRILEVSVRVRDICPGKRTAVGILLHEMDSSGNEYPRGVKTFTLPAHHEQSCRDIMLQCVRFVLPEDIGMGGGCANGSSCGQRRFVVRTIAHYVDTDCNCDCDED